ncbi:AimR family lysis-lysogeny pheromone receptor [Sediminibacillus massiliensis]|uniref:AimR family lysis-lysogeny pheromone receptor n=1 Tax=Sediminibacillus massiliensis TaxID=1926277 RepID=UPI0009883219|nr:AimR family lysis-lysogeny pheromone receptor [Sediminibacillus massiliensis]
MVGNYLSYQSATAVEENPMQGKYISLEQYMNFVSGYGEKASINLTRQFCFSSLSDNVQRVGMEFLYLHGYYSDLKKLIVRNKQSVNPINRKWGEVYQLFMDRKENIRPANEILKEIDMIKTNLPDLTCLIRFLKIYLHFDLMQFERFGFYLDKQSELIGEIEDSLLSSFFQLRYDEAHFMYYWRRNQVILARKYAFKALNTRLCHERKANIHVNLGLSYLFENYFSCIHHLEEAKKIGVQYDLKHIVHAVEQHNLPFVSAHFGYVQGVTTNDPSEQAHLSIAEGNMDKAREILNNLSLESPFRKYYKGLACEDRALLLRSYNEFIIQRSDYFFSRLPLKALKEKFDL